jgi:hypothetical protein
MTNENFDELQESEMETQCNTLGEIAKMYSKGSPEEQALRRASLALAFVVTRYLEEFLQHERDLVKPLFPEEEQSLRHILGAEDS